MPLAGWGENKPGEGFATPSGRLTKRRRLATSDEAHGILLFLRSKIPPYEIIAQNVLEAFVLEEYKGQLYRPWTISYDWNRIADWVRNQLNCDGPIQVSIGPPPPTSHGIVPTEGLTEVDSSGTWQFVLGRYYQTGTLPLDSDNFECLTLYATRQGSPGQKSILPAKPISTVDDTPTPQSPIVISDSKDSEEPLANSDHDVNEPDLEDDKVQAVYNGMTERLATRSISADDWISACRMFQMKEDSTDHRLGGFKLALSGYQIHAIWWQLTQYPLRGIPGGCLGDNMGLGKSIEVIGTFAVFAMIKANFNEVRNYWKTGEPVGGCTHLPELQDQSNDAICPSQHLLHSGLLCACVKEGPCYQVATALPLLPTLCVAPPSALHGWKGEFNKLIDAKHPAMRQLKLSIFHQDHRHDSEHFHDEDRVKETMARAVRPKNSSGQTFPIRLLEREGLSDWFLLVSSAVSGALTTAYSPRTLSQNSVPCRLATSFFFMDEYHLYHGTLQNPTRTIKLLRSVTESSHHPTVAIAVSASIPGGGLRRLLPIVDHILRVQKGHRADDAAQFGGIKEASKLEIAVSSWEYLVNRSHHANARIKAKVTKKTTMLQEKMADLVPYILMARRTTDTFRGTRIANHNQDIDVDQIRCDMLDGRGRAAFCKATAEVQTYVCQAYEEKRSAWESAGREGPEPTKASIEKEFFAAPGNIPMMGDKGGRAWTLLIRSNVYPAVAYLYRCNKIEAQDLEHTTVNRLGDETCMISVTQRDRASTLQSLRQSPFWKHRGMLERESLKFSRLCSFVSDMVAYCGRPPMAEDPGLKDGMNIRHMVVFADKPVSSYITFMLLTAKYPDINVMLINGKTRTKERKSAPGYSRQAIIDALMSDCSNDRGTRSWSRHIRSPVRR